MSVTYFSMCGNLSLKYFPFFSFKTKELQKELHALKGFENCYVYNLLFKEICKKGNDQMSSSLHILQMCSSHGSSCSWLKVPISTHTYWFLSPRINCFFISWSCTICYKLYIIRYGTRMFWWIVYMHWLIFVRQVVRSFCHNCLTFINPVSRVSLNQYWLS